MEDRILISHTGLAPVTPACPLRPARQALALCFVRPLLLSLMATAQMSTLAWGQGGEPVKANGLPPTIYVARAFHEAPRPNFETLRMRTESSDRTLTEVTDILFIESDGVVTVVAERTQSEIRDSGGKLSRKVIESRSRYVLGGLVFVAGQWTDLRDAPVGDPDEQQKGAATEGFSQVSGQLFPLAVGNVLNLSYISRLQEESETAHSVNAYRVVREMPATVFDAKLSGRIFVILNDYKEELAGEIYAGEEEIYYSEALGWPVRYMQKETDTGVTIETRLVEFTPRSEH